MRPMTVSAATAALLVGLAMPPRATAQTATCKDGTTASRAGQGACSHHGGVASINLTVSCRDGSSATPGRGACSHHGGVRHAKAVRAQSASRIRSTEKSKRGGTEDNNGPAPAESRSRIRSGGTVDCRDGTTSGGGQGACSHHGGVVTASQSNSGSEQSNGAATVDNNGSPGVESRSGTRTGETVQCRDGTTSGGGQGACSHHGGVETASQPNSAREPAPEPDVSAPDRSASGESADASALCNDGTYSHAEHREGACSYHKGVQKWLKDIPAR
jgi:uncharacterized protein DUF3761